MNLVDEVDAASLRDDIPSFRLRGTLKVYVKAAEGSRAHVQVLQGVVITRQGSGASETFAIRKVSFGVGVERTFLVHTPSIEKIEVVTRGQIRRAKLYYLRSPRGKTVRIKERREN